MIAARSDVIVTPSGRPAWMEAIEANWYEGSRWSPHRSWIWYPLQDAKKDLDRFTRYELAKCSRYLWKNSPLMRGLTERLVNLTIGCGIYPVPVSSKPEWNAKAKREWKRICRRPCVDSRATMSQYQRIKARQRFGDGEGFTLLSYNADTGRDGIQGFEADRITSAEGTERDNSRNVDGVLLNRQGMPAGYQVRGVSSAYPAEVMVHHHTPFRDGEVRSEPIFSACINTARDVDDILALEKQAVKDASSHKDIIQTLSGDLDGETLRKLQFNQQYPTPFSLPNDDKQRTDYYKVQFGAEPVVLRSGDKYTPYKPDRPGSAWQGFMAFLANSIVLSTGLPPSLLLPVEIGGTDIRRDLELAQRIVETWQIDLAGEWQEIWEYFIEGLIEDGPLMDAPEDWREVRWHFPKSITVDRGRDAQQDREDVRAGLMSRQEYHGRYGDDGDEYEGVVVSEAKRRLERIKAAGFGSVNDFVQVLTLDVAAVKDSELSKAIAEGGKSAPAGTAPPTPLNGAQITAALDVMVRVRERSLSAEAAAELLAQIGIERSKATAMARNVPAMDSGAGDVAFKREVLKSLLSVPAAREALYNSLDIGNLVNQTGLPAESGYQAPWLPVVAPAGQLVSGEPMKDQEGDVVGGGLVAAAPASDEPIEPGKND